MLQRLTEFLTLTGLTAMLTGGIGVANAVSGFIERRRRTIATYKSLGCPQRIVFRTFLIEIGLLALLGIAIGFAIAAAAPWASVSLMRGVVPIGIETGLQGRALALAALFGLLTALPFILWPIGRAQEVRAAELFRDSSGERPGLPPLGYRLAAFLAAGRLPRRPSRFRRSNGSPPSPAPRSLAFSRFSGVRALPSARPRWP